MPFQTLIATAGISALAPRNYIGKILRTPDSPVHFPDFSQNPIPKEPETDADTITLHCLEHVQKHLDLSEIDPALISAEFSVFTKLRDSGDLAESPRIELIHTPTLGGRLAIELQQAIWQQKGATIHPAELTIPFDPSQHGGLALASGAFMGTVSRLLRHHTTHTAAFAPIGGYKVMVSLGHAAASYHGFHSLYLHEDSQVLQTLTPLPVSLPRDPALASLALKINDGHEISTLTTAEQTTLEKHPAFFRKIENLVELNELGQFLRLHQFPVHLSQQAAEALRKNTKNLTNQLHQIRDHAAQNPDHPGINHDLTTNHGRNHPWRLAKMGEGIRIKWQIANNTIIVGHIWRDHDTYNKEAPTSVTLPLPENLTTYTPLAL